MDQSLNERAYAQAYEVWRSIAAEPFAWSFEDAPAGVRPDTKPRSAAGADPAAGAVVRAIVAVANAPLPSVAIASLLLAPVRRLRLASFLTGKRRSPAPVLRGRAIA